ncbi:tRNA 2-thiouridine(34) synthase MnmA [bacterium]|nr:MAG: tRNA 2-thiouridine(34) synthase MnmA [bacterium]
MRIAVAMSGGVDSSVAALLLASEGHEVVGLTLKVWEDSRCCSVDDADDARRVARNLKIPHFVIDAREVFEELVINPFVETYREGLTPNPCVLCNRKLKFDWLARKAGELGCEAVATGHYARITAGPGGLPQLWRGLDHSKDQSYFVVPDSLEHLSRLRFPLGGYTKAKIRELAAGRGLPVAGKPDSQDLCFTGEGGLAGFLAQRVKRAEPGEITDLTGKRLGTHEGLHAYTLGQRRGLSVSSTAPLYVVKKDLEGNRLMLGRREDLFSREFHVTGAVWLDPEIGGKTFDCAARTRSTGEITPCTVTPEGSGFRVELASPQFAVTPGQLAVFYEGERVLGSGWIKAPASSFGE